MFKFVAKNVYKHMLKKQSVLQENLHQQKAILLVEIGGHTEIMTE